MSYGVLKRYMKEKKLNLFFKGGAAPGPRGFRSRQATTVVLRHWVDFLKSAKQKEG